MLAPALSTDNPASTTIRLRILVDHIQVKWKLTYNFNVIINYNIITLTHILVEK